MKNGLLDKEEEIEFVKALVRQYSTKLQEKDHNLQVLQGRLAAAVEQHHEQDTQIIDLNKALSKQESEMHNVQLRLTATQEDLQACRDDIFNMQPPTQTEDADIANHFDSLCQLTANWVDSEITKLEDAYPNVRAHSMFAAAGKPLYEDLLKKYPEAGEYVVRHEIHAYLQRTIIGEAAYLPGLPFRTRKVLQDIEEGMALLEPVRGSNVSTACYQLLLTRSADSKTINNWRSETIRAICATKTYNTSKDENLARVTFGLFDHIRNYLPMTSENEQCMQRLFDQVVIPAAQFAPATSNRQVVMAPLICQKNVQFMWQTRIIFEGSNWLM